MLDNTPLAPSMLNGTQESMRRCLIWKQHIQNSGASPRPILFAHLPFILHSRGLIFFAHLHRLGQPCMHTFPSLQSPLRSFPHIISVAFVHPDQFFLFSNPFDTSFIRRIFLLHPFPVYPRWKEGLGELMWELIIGNYDSMTDNCFG